MSRIKALAGQTAIYGVTTIVGRMLNWGLTPFYTHKWGANLETAQFGVVTELYSYVAFLMVIFMYGMETAFFRFFQNSDNQPRTFSTALWSVVGSTVVLSGLGVLFAPSIASWINYEELPQYIVWFAIIIGLDAITAIPFALLRAQNKALKFGFIKVVNIAINIGLNLFFYLVLPKIKGGIFGLEYEASIGVGYIFISNLVASLLTLAMLLPQFKGLKAGFDTTLWKNMLRYAWPLIIVGFAGTINEMLDRVLLKYLLDGTLLENQSQLGIYGACYKLSIFMTMFVMAFRYAAEPFFFGQANKADAKEMYAKVMRFFTIIGCLIFLGVSLNLEWIQYLIGESYREGMVVVPILLVANLLLGIYYNLAIWYKLTDRTRYGAVMAIIGAAVTLVLNLLWIPKFGYIGSAWATLICYAVMVLMSYFLGRKYYRVEYPVVRIACYALGAIGIFLLSEWLHANVWQSSSIVKVAINLVWLAFYGAVVLRMEVLPILKARKQ